MHAYFLEGASDVLRPALERALEDARRTQAGYGDASVGNGFASLSYAAAAVIELAAALELDENDLRAAAAAVAEACALPLPSARFLLFSRIVASPALLELPPLLAAEIQLGLLLAFDVLQDVSLWRRARSGPERVLALGGAGHPSRRVRAEAKAVLRGRSRLSLFGGSQLRSVAVERFGEPYAAVVGRLGRMEPEVADAYLAEIGPALAPVLEREHLLERSAER
ncbi:MAG: hypothetical protein NZL88_01845, partial [Gaiellaceae bacterium]|nr:hypothetical protein [Gaiellaceae bacterium]